jgi:hypothetical protein
LGPDADLWQKETAMPEERTADTAHPNAAPRTRLETRARALSLLPVLLVLWSANGVADAEVEARYPYDPACAWGRIANGKGMLHRCLTEAEARSVAESDPARQKPKGTLPEAPAEAKPSEPSRDFVLEVGPPAPEEGELALGGLGKPTDRYRACVEENGGLLKPSAQVVVEFLVRAERSRAEGTEVRSFAGVSRAAAECLAEVVDRRATGTPSVPMTGVKLTFSLTAK